MSNHNPSEVVTMIEPMTRQIQRCHHRTTAALVMASGAGVFLIVAYLFGAL